MSIMYHCHDLIEALQKSEYTAAIVTENRV